MERRIYSRETGYVYSQFLRSAAIILIVVPFIVMQEKPWLAAVVALIGFIAFDATTGVKINLGERKVMMYTNVFGVYLGKWNAINKDAGLIITYIYRKQKRKPKAMPENPLSLRDMEFFVHITDAEQKPVTQIYKCFEEQEAIDFAMVVGEELDMEIYDYFYNEIRQLRKKGDPPRFEE